MAADKPPVKIGILTDTSGTYAGMGGPGSVAAAQLAIDDCLAAECKGMEIDLVSADNQNKTDVGPPRRASGSSTAMASPPSPI